MPVLDHQNGRFSGPHSRFRRPSAVSLLVAIAAQEAHGAHLRS